MSRRRSASALAAGLAALCLAASLGSAPSTYAAFSDSDSISVRAGAGIWAPDPPLACGPIKNYRGIVWGTTGDDVLMGGNHPQIIMGLDGDDVLYGGNSGDCLVGGPGKDRLIGGNAKDILIGGPGDDYLSGGNAKDALDGSEDLDICDGGNGKDTVVNCEYEPGDLMRAPQTPSQQGLGAPGSPVEEAPIEPAATPQTPEGTAPEKAAPAPPDTQAEPVPGPTPEPPAGAPEPKSDGPQPTADEPPAQPQTIENAPIAEEAD